MNRRAICNLYLKRTQCPTRSKGAQKRKTFKLYTTTDLVWPKPRPCYLDDEKSYFSYNIYLFEIVVVPLYLWIHLPDPLQALLFGSCKGKTILF